MKKFVYLATCILLFASCVSNYYVVDNKVNGDGGLTKSVYTKADSAYINGDESHWPYLFAKTSEWYVDKYDSINSFRYFGDEIKYNLCAVRKFDKNDKISIAQNDEKSAHNPFANPKESVTSRFRWFVSYYTYIVKFDSILLDMPIPLDSFLSKQEQKLWFCDYKNDLSGMNGAEIYEVLDGINDKVIKWYYKNQYEICIDIIEENLFARHEISYDEKSDIYNKYFSKGDFVFNDVLNVIAAEYDVDLKSVDKEGLDSAYDEKNSIFDLMKYAFVYKVDMPGKIYDSNGCVMKDNAAAWKIDAHRLVLGEYEIYAKSYKVEYWTIIFSVMVLIIACVFVFKGV